MPSAKTDKGRAQRPGTAQRSAILDKAFALFARQGYRRTSFGDIAEAVGLSRPAIYHYFRNKDEVFRAVGERIIKDVSLAIEGVLGRPGPLEERLAAVFEARAGRDYALLHVSPFGRELIDERTRLTGDTEKSVARQVETALIALLSDAEARGEIALAASGTTAEEAARLLEHFFDGLLANEPAEDRASRAAALMVHFFVEGLGPKEPR